MLGKKLFPSFLYLMSQNFFRWSCLFVHQIFHTTPLLKNLAGICKRVNTPTFVLEIKMLFDMFLKE